MPLRLQPTVARSSVSRDGSKPRRADRSRSKRDRSHTDPATPEWRKVAEAIARLGVVSDAKAIAAVVSSSAKHGGRRLQRKMASRAACERERMFLLDSDGYVLDI
jgi:hypothetical protein